MSEASSSATDSFSVEVLRRVDEVCRRFEEAWKRDQPPRLEDFLVEAKGSERTLLLGELLRLELHYRSVRGEPSCLPSRPACSRTDSADRFNAWEIDRRMRTDGSCSPRSIWLR